MTFADVTWLPDAAAMRAPEDSPGAAAPSQELCLGGGESVGLKYAVRRR
jgi:hypothetical protein